MDGVLFEDVKWPNSEGYKVGRRWLRLFELLRNPLIDLFTDRDGFLIGNRDISRTSVNRYREGGLEPRLIKTRERFARGEWLELGKGIPIAVVLNPVKSIEVTSKGSSVLDDSGVEAEGQWGARIADLQDGGAVIVFPPKIR